MSLTIVHQPVSVIKIVFGSPVFSDVLCVAEAATAAVRIIDRTVHCIISNTTDDGHANNKDLPTYGTYRYNSSHRKYCHHDTTAFKMMRSALFRSALPLATKSRCMVATTSPSPAQFAVRAMAGQAESRTSAVRTPNSSSFPALVGASFCV